MVSSGSSVHYDRTLQKNKEGTKHNRLTAISTSFIDSTTENAEEMGLFSFSFFWLGERGEMRHAP